MKLSKLARQNARQLFRSCLVNGLLEENRVRQVVTQVASAKPRGYYPTLQEFRRLVALELARRSARVESAVPLSPAFQESVQANLARLYGPGLEIAFAQNPALLGGLCVRVGSDVYDGSIQSRLGQLEQSL